MGSRDIENRKHKYEILYFFAKKKLFSFVLLLLLQLLCLATPMCTKLLVTNFDFSLRAAYKKKKLLNEMILSRKSLQLIKIFSHTSDEFLNLFPLKFFTKMSKQKK